MKIQSTTILAGPKDIRVVLAELQITISTADDVTIKENIVLEIQLSDIIAIPSRDLPSSNVSDLRGSVAVLSVVHPRIV